MAIIESTVGTAMAVDAGFNAARVSVRPPETTSWLSLGMQTSAMTGVATGTTGLIFALRNLAANPIMIRRVGLGFITSTAFTAAQMVSFGLIVARNWSVSDTGGSIVTLTGNNAKHRSTMGNLTSVDARVSSTAALGNGSKTLDGSTLAQVAGWSGGLGTTIAPALSNLFGHDSEDYPLIIGQNEGINIQNLTAMGAGGAGIAIINLELAEMVAF
jgi:hypothetical protein